MSPPWMPFYVADYLADTLRLTTIEHGAYVLLIMEYWRNGGLPDDDRRLARIVGLQPGEWTSIRDNIADLFQPGWKHKRIDVELEKAGSRSNAAKAKAEKRWHSQGNAAALPEQCKGNAISQPESDTELASASSKREGAKPTPRSVLLECLKAETADAVIEHRKAKRAPLTHLAARQLVKGFLATGDPEAAATMMVARGWQGFEPEWFEKERSNARNGKSVQEAARSLAERGGIDFGPIPPRYVPSGRPGGSTSGNPIRLLPEGRHGGPGDLCGGGSVDPVLLSVPSRLPGD